MAKVLLAWELGGGAGHYVKLAPIAERLAARGHRAVAVVRDLATAQPFFQHFAVSYFQAPYLVGQPLRPIHWPRTLAQILQNTGFGEDSHLEVLVSAWRSIFAAVQPDIVICDHAPTALLASRWFDCRRVVVGTGFEVPPNDSPWPDIEYWQPETFDATQANIHERTILNRVNCLLEGGGRLPLSQLAELYADVDRAFLLTFAELDHYPHRGATTYWGAWPPQGGCVADWPHANGPRLFAYLKPERPQWLVGEFLAFLSHQPIASLVYIPGAEPDWQRQFQSPQLQFVSQPVDIGKIAKTCDVAVLNGNAGSVAEFLLHGVPLLNIPLHLEQLVTAHRVADLGAGLMADARRPAEMAQRLLALLSSPQYRAAAQSFAQKYADYDPVKSADQVAAEINQLIQ